MNKLFILVISLLLVSCASKPLSDLEKPPVMIDSDQAPVVASAPPKHAPTAIYVPEFNTVTNILYRSFLLPYEKPNQSLTTFIYLPKKPVTETEIKQYNMVCKAWMNSLSLKEELVSYYDPKTENLVPFYWSTKFKLSKPICSDMIEYYDYARMMLLMQRNKLDTDKIQLVSLYQKLNVTMDISSLTVDEDIVNSFNIWKSYMTKAPQKSEKLNPFTLTQSLKKVLGALGYLVTSSIKS